MGGWMDGLLDVWVSGWVGKVEEGGGGMGDFFR